ncbi:unnamed protein product [Fraxinus pennsylvanica]|uniref:Uncharacterized protein n=1 Tax=Fraxinus pennsylvanica TaxID=56036 RepID=A0AAD1ZIK7_9LAMI|nr:unnamed protein product [Fraxinus pennsylvanica]
MISLTGRGRSVPRVLILGLPDDSNGDSVASVGSCVWEWKPKCNVHDENSGSENLDSPVWALDFLGQSMSLPSKDPPLRRKDGNGSILDGENYVWGFGDKTETETWAELVYSVDLWRDQVPFFVEDVVGNQFILWEIRLEGLSHSISAYNPQLVRGVTLLNATPFWGFLPNPARSPKLSRLFPMAGTFPVPSSVRKLLEVLWLKISDPRSIEEILKQVYADHSTKVDDMFSHIIETAQHPAVAASFASIMFAPQGVNYPSTKHYLAYHDSCDKEEIVDAKQAAYHVSYGKKNHMQSTNCITIEKKPEI